MKQSLRWLAVLLIVISGLTFAQDEVLQGHITANRTLTADKTYLLKEFVRIDNGVTLTIEAGTTIYGESSSQGSLIVLPGGKLVAEGTAEKPIVFTSEYTKEGASRKPTYGDWGGIILLGNAPINVPGGTSSIEGPGDTYGGSNAEDSSGVLKYVRIEYPGIAFSLNNEINGLTFGGVGSKTVIDYVQVSYSGDDSFEWFGGTVNCKHLIAYRGWDDDFDTDFGYSGKLQYLFSVRDPEIADQSGSNGFESDNDGSGSTNSPRTSPTWWNVTLLGPKATAGTTINTLYKRGMHLRRSSQNKVNNALIMGWPTGVLVDGKNTIADADAGVMYVKNSIVAGSTKALDTASSNGTFNITAWFGNSANNSSVLANTSDVMLTNAYNLSNPNLMPVAGSPVFTNAGTPPNDGFFDANANFIGAFGTENWTSGWARFDSTTIGIEDDPISNVVPGKFELSQNYPNPFNPTTKIQYSVVSPVNVKLSIYNMLGQEVEVLVNSFKNVGTYEVVFDASKLTSGIYIYRLEAGMNVTTRKMTLLK